VKQARKVHQRLAFLPVSKACTNKLYIFRQYVYDIFLSLGNICISQESM